jgi:hypothetical protein
VSGSSTHFWTDFCTGWEIGMYFQFSTSGYSVFPVPFDEEAICSPFVFSTYSP